MENRTALIVDDSRTASHILRRMLEKDKFQVEVRDSAEEAIEYLDAGRPGVIFMDHMMPGLDGFQAVKVIKGKRETASIPIVMYTSKSGELYIGQARALGAADILLKPPTRQSLQEVFGRLDAMQLEQHAHHAVPVAETEEVVVEEGALDELDSDTTPSTPTPTAKETPTPFLSIPDTEPEPRSSPVTVFGAIVLSFLIGYGLARLMEPEQISYGGFEWAVSASPLFAQGEPPFGGERVELVRQLLARLESSGFSGTVQLEGHLGAFCLVSDGANWVLPASTLPIESCEKIGYGTAEASRMSGVQSTEFRYLSDNSPLLDNIRLEILPARGQLATSSIPTTAGGSHRRRLESNCWAEQPHRSASYPRLTLCRRPGSSARAGGGELRVAQHRFRLLSRHRRKADFCGVLPMQEDIDPTETAEWLDAFDAVVRHQGRSRASFLLRQLADRATNNDVDMPSAITTPYRNTIPPIG